MKRKAAELLMHFGPDKQSRFRVRGGAGLARRLRHFNELGQRRAGASPAPYDPKKALINKPPTLPFP